MPLAHEGFARVVSSILLLRAGDCFEGFYTARAKLRRTVAFVPCPLCSCFENYFCRIKDWRRSATRYDKFARNFVAAAALFGAICWIKLLGQTLV
jgi:transposase